MHMSDALITPIVGGVTLATSVGVLSYSTKKLESDILDKRIAYMGVVSAFVFAAQMINFSIPGTGSSGHIGGGLLLAILLGPHAGFLAMATVLLTQALFFADGGLLAFGCNLLNLGFFTCYVAYPLIYKPLSKGSKKKMCVGIMLATIIGLQLGSLGVVIETMLSGRTDLPFDTFLLFMQPIHLAIGLVEGLITVSVVGFLYERREALLFDFFSESFGHFNTAKMRRRAFQGFFIVALIIGGVFSQFASSNPDGLEWSIDRVVVEASETTSNVGDKKETGIKKSAEELQEAVAFLPDYDFSKKSNEDSVLGTSVSGVVGSLIILITISLSGLLIRKFQQS